MRVGVVSDFTEKIAIIHLERNYGAYEHKDNWLLEIDCRGMLTITNFSIFNSRAV